MTDHCSENSVSDGHDILLPAGSTLQASSDRRTPEDVALPGTGSKAAPQRWHMESARDTAMFGLGCHNVVAPPLGRSRPHGSRGVCSTAERTLGDFIARSPVLCGDW